MPGGIKRKFIIVPLFAFAAVAAGCSASDPVESELGQAMVEEFLT